MFQLSLPDQPWAFETQLFSIIQTLCEKKIFTAPFNHLDKGPHTLQQKLRNMRLSSIHTTTFFTTATTFSAVLSMGNDFQNNTKKNLCSFMRSVQGP